MVRSKASDAADPDDPVPPEAAWSLTTEEVAEALRLSLEQGLSDTEVRHRRRRFGENQLRQSERRSGWAILVEQFKSLVVVLLAAATVAALLLGHTIDAIAIAVVIFLNTAIGFWTEYGAVQSMEALRKMGEIEATAVRSGEARRLAARHLVPGDLVHLSRGDVVPADLRVLRADDLEVDESALTGESVPVSKSSDPVAETTELAERTSMLFRGTVVTRGEAEAIAVSTGMETELGEISRLVEQADRDRVPLEERLDQLGRTLVWLVLVVAGLVGLAGALAGRPLLLMIETSLALAIAAVPEGLPIVATVALSYGVWQMKQRQALVRYLPSVETLGATTTICVDKTGTLTENRMSVELLATPEEQFTLQRDDEGGARLVDADDATVEVTDDTRLRRAVEVAVLANKVDDQEAGTEADSGPTDPMAVALVEMGEDIGRARSQMLQQWPLARLVPFDTEINMMATVHEADDGYMVAVQGAPEDVLDRCSSVFDREEPLDDSTRDRLRERIDGLAARGYRVIGLATQTVSDPEDALFSELAFVGLVGLIDPPRDDVAPAIDQCHRAGVRTVMVTGDHPQTARNIAKQVGLIQNDDAPPVVGSELQEPTADSESRRTRLLETEVLARVTPRQKLDLIDLLADRGEIVAMTGDGVNDAPALQSSDIGIAMGERGTQVAREAADMILLDDSFPTIVQALEQGRIIFENIRKFVVYLLSGNIGEILLVGVAAALGAPLPLLPLQILYLNVLNDVFPALALGMGPASGHEMEEPPRSTDSSILEPSDWREVGIYGLVIALAVGAGFLVGLGAADFSTERAVTVSFLSLSTARLLHVFNMRRSESGLLVNEICRNPFVWGALGLDIGLLLLAVYVPLLANVLSLTPPGPIGWAIVGTTALLPLLFGQLYLTGRSLSQSGG